MDNDLEDLKNKMIALSDNELLRIVHIEFDNYREEAVAIAKEELKKRNIREITDDEKETRHKKVKEEKKRDKTTAGIISSLIVYSIGKALSSILPQVITAIIIGASMGALVGMIPYVVGKKKGQLGLAQVAFFVTTAAGAGFGLVLAVPVSFVFIVALLIREKQTETQSGEWIEKAPDRASEKNKSSSQVKLKQTNHIRCDNCGVEYSAEYFTKNETICNECSEKIVSTKTAINQSEAHR